MHRCRLTRRGNIIQESGEDENGGKKCLYSCWVFFSFKQRVVTEATEWRKSLCLCRVCSSTPYKSRIFFFPITAPPSRTMHIIIIIWCIHYSGAECKLIYTAFRIDSHNFYYHFDILIYCAFDRKQCSDVKLYIYIGTVLDLPNWYTDRPVCKP